MKTLRMIATGGLIEVNERPTPPKGHDPNPGSALESSGGAADALDESFPGYKALKEAGITTRTQLAGMSPEQRIGVKGIGPTTAEEIEAALKSATKK